MKLGKIKELLDAEVLCNEDLLDYEAASAFACDLMSDVLSLAKKETILLTGLTNIQAVRTAEMLDLKCIIFVRNKRPDESVIELAREKGICVLFTKYTLFTACGILYTSGLKGADLW